MAKQIVKLEDWYEIQDNGAGDYYLVPVGLFEPSMEECGWCELVDVYNEKLAKCIYIGGFATGIKIKGEVEL